MLTFKGQVMKAASVNRHLGQQLVGLSAEKSLPIKMNSVLG